MVATRRPDFISATAMCIATVDLPEPPFSLPTTIMRAFVLSRDMSALQNAAELPDYAGFSWYDY